MSNGDFEADWIAWLLAHNYNFIPYDALRYEETEPTDNIGSHFFANKSHRAKIWIQYDKDKLEPP